MESEIREYQKGFWKGKSTVDAIHTINQVIEKCYVGVQILFIDFKQAFDSLKGRTIIKDMEQLNVSQKIIRLVKMTMKDSRARVMRREGPLEEFEINAEVRQGDGLSAVLFNIAVDGIIEDCNINGSIINKSKQIIALEKIVKKVGKED